MLYTKLGDTGLEVSRLGFGAMRPPKLDGGEWDSDLFVRCMQHAIDLGVNYIDTAHVYGGGKSEEHVARAVKGRRDKVVISTKVPLGWDDSRTPDEWERMMEESLKRLGPVDIFFFHDQKAVTFDGPNWEEFVRRAEKIVDRGDIRFLAASTHESTENAKRFLDTGLFKVLLVQYNMLNMAYDEVMAYAKGKGIGTVVMGPVGGGVLATDSGIIRELSPVPVESNAELALRLVLSNPNVDSALSGMNSIEMVEENARAASLDPALTGDERQKLLQAIDERLALREKICTQCGYCEGCPEKIDIKRLFGAYTTLKMWGLEKRARREYRRATDPEKGKSARASACAECGECEPKCPQKIEIVKQMAEVAAAFDRQAPPGGEAAAKA